MDMKKLALVCLLFAPLAACGGDEPVSYSAPVGISLSVSSGDVQDGALLDEKNINTESGNPYAVYIADAREEIGGDPGSITLETATLELLGTSNNVTTLGEVFAGDVAISFVMNSSGAEYPATVITVGADTGAGPVDMHTHFDDASITGTDWEEFVGGSFKVVLTGPAAASFPAANADANMQATFTFAAYE